MSEKIRLMTFNIQHGFDHVSKSGIRLKLIADQIKRFSPDIVTLNEVRGGKELPHEEDAVYDNALYFEQTKYLSELCGMEYSAFGRSIYIGGGEYGNAVLSRFPIKSKEVFPIEDTYTAPGTHLESRTVLRLILDVNGKDVCVMTSHFGCHANEEREKAVSRVLSLYEGSKELSTFLSGDFNDSPDAKEFAPLYDTFDDALIKTGNDAKTFVSDAPEKRIDYIFVSRNVRCLSAFVPQDAVASDHLPVVADLLTD